MKNEIECGAVGEMSDKETKYSENLPQYDFSHHIFRNIYP
jgi:hypothetical protein